MQIPPSPAYLEGRDRIVVPSGGGCLSIFGLPFFAAGLFMFSGAFGIVDFDGDIPVIAHTVLFVMGCVFTAVGGFLLFMRQKIIIDRAAKTVSVKKRILLYKSEKYYKLGRNGNIALELHAGDSDTADSYPVFLNDPDGARRLEIFTSSRFGNSNRLASFVAEFLSLPYQDKTTGIVERPPEEQKAKTAPAQTNFSHSGGKTEITLPNGPSGIIPVVILVVLFAVFGPVSGIAHFMRGLTEKARNFTFEIPEKIDGATVYVSLSFFELAFTAVIAALFFGFLFFLFKKRGRLLTVSDEGIAFEGKFFPSTQILSVNCKISNRQIGGRIPNGFDADAIRGAKTKKALIGFLERHRIYANAILIKTVEEIREIPTYLPDEETRQMCEKIRDNIKPRAK